MNRGRSFLILLVVALGLGAYIFLVESKRDLADPATKKEKLFTLDASKLEAVEVRAADGTTTSLKKDGETWRIVAPEALDADEAQVSSLVNTLESAEVQRVIDAKPTNVKDFGLEPARYSISFRAAGETAMKRLDLGNKTPTGADLYARVEGDPKLLLLSGYLEDSLNRTTFDLREKTVLKFTRDAVDAIQVHAEAAKPTEDTKDAKDAKDAKDTKDTKGAKDTKDAKGAKPAAKTPPATPVNVSLTKKGNDWRLTAPVDARADFGTVEGLIGRLEQARMKSIVAPAATTPADLKKYGFDKPQGQVTLGAGSTRATLILGAKHDDTSVYARDASRPLVFTVESSILDDLRKRPDDIRVKDIFTFRSFSAISVDVVLGGQTYSFGKDKPAAEQSTTTEVWKQKAPAAKDVDQTKFTDLLSTLSNLRADSFVDKAFTTPDVLTIVAKSGDAAAPVEERVTFRKSGDVVHAIRAGETSGAVVPTVELDKALALAKELTGVK
jgi:hypothetical protein